MQILSVIFNNRPHTIFGALDGMLLVKKRKGVACVNRTFVFTSKVILTVIYGIMVIYQDYVKEANDWLLDMG